MIKDEKRPTTKQLGRPRTLAEPGASLTVWLGQTEYDRLFELAQKRSVTVSKLVRSLLILRLPQT